MTYPQGDTLRAGILQGVSYFALIAVAFMALLFAAWKWDSTRTNETLQQSEDALVLDMREQLPPGASRADVEKFLTAHGMPQPYYLNYGGPNPVVDGATAVVFTRTPPVGNMVHSCWVLLYFRLDGSGRLMGYSHESRCSSYLMNGNHDEGTPLLR
jgi:hypothetical protein